MDGKKETRQRLIGLLGLAGMLSLVAAGYLAAKSFELWDDDAAQAFARQWVEWARPAGPLAIIGLMTFAIVFSPLPSAPIALAAGAIYGHIWGTIYVIAGAELGALGAFALARWLGRDVLRRWLRVGGANTFLDRFMRSQNALTFAVFASRLMPFLSFDVVSYAAGLTPLAAWRFAGATLAGIAPASFALAHLGGVAASGDFAYGGVLTLTLGVLVLSPILWKALLRR
jgi:uncharacterized membrane protein YdjX (TVP38/TMEM64 family)